MILPQDIPLNIWQNIWYTPWHDSKSHWNSPPCRPYPAVGAAVLLSNAFIAALGHLETPPVWLCHGSCSFGKRFGCRWCIPKVCWTLVQKIYTPEEECNCVEIVDILLAHYCQIPKFIHRRVSDFQWNLSLFLWKNMYVGSYTSRTKEEEGQFSNFKSVHTLRIHLLTNACENRQEHARTHKQS